MRNRFNLILRDAANEGAPGGEGAAAPVVPAPVAPAAPASPTAAPVKPGTPVTAEAPKPGEAPAPEAPAPLTAEDITVPEGFELNEASRDAFLAVVNDATLDPKARTNALVEMHTKAMADAQTAGAEAWIARQTASAKLITDDPTIGGANLVATQAKFAAVLDEFGSPELREQIDISGIGNQKPFADFLLKVSEIISEGNPVVGDPTSGETKTTANTLYPTQGKV